MAEWVRLGGTNHLPLPWIRGFTRRLKPGKSMEKLDLHKNGSLLNFLFLPDGFLLQTRGTPAARMSVLNFLGITNRSTGFMFLSGTSRTLG